ncbi:MAG: hypothetical protein WBQ14_02795 [Gaiellaceae bacterium]
MSKGLLNETLDILAPTQEEVPSWETILARAGIENPAPAKRPLWKRTWVAAVVVAVAVLVPLTAIGSEQDWWFFHFGGQSLLKPATGVSVVKTGSWDGNEWELVAFRSETQGLCFGILPTRLGAPANSAGGGLSCGSVAGVPRTPAAIPNSLMITFLAGAIGGIEKNEQAVPYAVGPVSEVAVQVDIHLRDGEIVHTPAFGAPEELSASIRFYATQLPPGALPSTSESGARTIPITKLVGLDRAGRVVACLLVPSGKHELSDCA